MEQNPQTVGARTEPGNRGLTFIIIAVIVALGLVIGHSLVVKSVLSSKDERLPLLRRMDRAVDLTQRDGKVVDMLHLRGKVVVVGYVFTRCPRGCPGILGEMFRLREAYLDQKNEVHFVSVSVDTEHDTPEVLRDFAKKWKIADDDNWWFLTGEKQSVARLMSSLLGFQPTREIPETERMSPDDRFLHDMRLALVDQDGHVRGYYEIMNPDPDFAKRSQEALTKDIQKLLKEKK